MYCPRCAAQNIDDAKFCRSCGADISLVPQALSGRLPENRPANLEIECSTNHLPRQHKGGKEPSLEKAIKKIFLGIGFVLVAFGVLFFAPGGRNWWFWMFIPAFALLGGGVAEFARLKLGGGFSAAAGAATPAVPLAPHINTLPPHKTSRSMPPSSVTEGTTRILDTPTSREKMSEN